MRLKAIIVILILTACLFSPAGTAAEPASHQSTYVPYVPPVAEESARAGLVSFLEEARNYTLEHGKDGALRAFCDPKGKFVRGDMYVFAYDFNGTLLAHPYLHSLLGRNNLDLVDVNGVPIIRNIMEVAKRGQGFACNAYPNPNRADQTALKLVYVLKVDDDMWIGSGIYLPGEVPLFSFEDGRRLKAFVEEAKGYAQKVGKDSALEAFKDPEGEFVRGDLYVFAFDFQGNTLCLPFQPELAGTNRLDAEDSNGIAFTRDNMGLAKDGSGLNCYIYPNPKNNMSEELKLSYVVKVDDGWWLGSGIYSGRTSSQNSSSFNASAMKPADRDDLKAFVEEARSHALVVEKGRALRDFMDLSGPWARGDVYIFAHDFNGTALCLPYLPEAVGTNRMDIQNDRGAYINREMRDIAMKGSGFYEYTWRNPITNQSEPKVSYVTRVDDTWYLGAGIYGA